MADAAPTLADRATARDERWRGHAALLVVQVLFGLFPVVRDWAPAHFTPASIVGWRIAVGATVLLVAAFAMYRRQALPSARDLPLLFVCALLGVTVNMVLFLEGLDRSTPVNAGLLMPVIPVFTYVIAIALRQERLEWLRGLGIAVAMTGTVLLVFQRGPELDRRYLFGNLLIVTNALCYAAYLVLARPLTRRYPPLVVVAWVFALSTPMIPVLTAIRPADFVPDGATANEWIALAYILIGATVLAYLLNGYALSKVTASTTAAYIFLQPLVTIGAAHFWRGKPILPSTWISAVCIFGGLSLVLWRPSISREVASSVAE